MPALTPLTEVEFLTIRRLCANQADKIHDMFEANMLEATYEDEAREGLRAEYTQLILCLLWLDENRKSLLTDKRKDSL